MPPYLHNGAAENLFSVITNANHRTAGGQVPDPLPNLSDQVAVFAFLETIDAKTVPFVPLSVRLVGGQVIVGFDSLSGVSYSILGRTNLATGSATILTNVVGTGTRFEVSLPNNAPARFLRLIGP